MKYLMGAMLVSSIALSASVEAADHNRFFADDSFWNQPISKDAKIDENSDRWISILAKEPNGAFFGVNTDKYTIPLFYADDKTPRFTIYHRPVDDKFKSVHGHNNGWFDHHDYYGHGPGFGENVPIPEDAMMDPEEDAHIAIVDPKTNTVWDMWGAKKIDGKWHSFTGMKYSSKGSGTFEKIHFPAKDGESIHFFGPSRAAGVPAVAGLVLFDEVKAGAVNHKVACATRFNAKKEFVYPAVWTDGVLDGGLPEGSVIQLDPNLDLNKFNLTPEEKVLAVALQKYGLVIVDQGGANAIYAEGLYGQSKNSWKGKIRGWEAGIISIPIKHYRVLKVGETKRMGTNSEVLDKLYFQAKEFLNK